MTNTKGMEVRLCNKDNVVCITNTSCKTKCITIARIELSKDDFKEFISENINLDRIVFSAVGNLSLNQFKRLTEKYLKEIPLIKNAPKREKFVDYKPTVVSREKRSEQALCVIGRTTFDIHNPEKYSLILLNNILGGPAMNSRLNLALREKRGFVYSIESGFTPYTDSGVFSIFFGTRPDRLNKSIALVKKELNILKEKKLGIRQLSKGKEQLIGQLQILEENNSHQMIKLASNQLDYGRIESIDEKVNRIRNISSSDILGVANELFDDNKMSILTYNPI